MTVRAPVGQAWPVLARMVDRYQRLSLRSGSGPGPAHPVQRELAVLVQHVTAEADGVVSLRLVPAPGGPLPQWRPGSHLDVRLPSGRIRQYSLCGDPADRSSYRIAVRLLPVAGGEGAGGGPRAPGGGGGSAEVHSLRPGTALTVRRPRNAFPFIRAQRYFFVAGGIGITPILPMVGAATRAGVEWTLCYAGRTEASLPFLAELHELADQAGHRGRIVLSTDRARSASTIAEVLATAPPGARAYCCGPPGLVHAVDQVRRQLPQRAIVSMHYERFSAPPVVGGEPFEMSLVRQGISLLVGGDETALQAVRRVLPDVAFSCQQGFCGTCRVPLLAGEVDHRDRVLTSTGRGTELALCVSRGRGPIVVDL
ncbi:PDR/VanB family oxidoreductase [Jatrophihabitans telluris]|uniref:PDR/VanB family oxidoreductase n=1 Tax=Jatrophihabitans telluris TaxID=2038343 RepID=A0ABY4QYK1_9ACTN|nr:PDR/VanB family oxidoreductase [Jatrophihabitans telluris]UQX88610.1 PDR/VanB family oxidoreductase [Jatrophihabitans telluris]